MIDLVTYKWLHLVGVFLIVMSFGSLIYRSASGAETQIFSKRKLSIVHGIGMLLSLVGGFGMLARLGISHGDWPSWVSVKFGIWLSLGLLIAAVNRSPLRAATWWWLILLLVMSAAYLGLNHSVIG
jgi:hypothetical protein